MDASGGAGAARKPTLKPAYDLLLPQGAPQQGSQPPAAAPEQP